MDASHDLPSAASVITALGLVPHPEGGWYAETWRAPEPVGGGRPASSAIVYLLQAGERSHWHRVDADEIWQFAAGAPLELRTWAGGDALTESIRLGDVTLGHAPQAVVPAGVWQAAQPLGAWTLAGCIVAPAFDFGGFELAMPDWDPPT